MKKKIVQFTIEDPCHESWDNMTPTERGRFCHSCAKPVVDFTSMTDFDVMQYMVAAKGSVCGKMTSNQLNRDFTQYELEQARSFSVRALVLGAALSTFSAATSYAQSGTTKVEENKTIEHHHPYKVGMMKQIPPKTALQDSVVSGYVKDEMGYVIPGVRVILYDKEAKELTSVLSDQEGKYKLVLDPSSSDKPDLIVFTMFGYYDKSFPYSTAESHGLEVVTLSAQVYEMMGAVKMEEPKDSRKQKHRKEK